MTGFLVLSVVLCALLSALTGALGYALRDFSRSKLEAILESRGRARRLQPLLEHTNDFILIVASVRLFTILLLLGGLLQLADRVEQLPDWGRYLSAIIIAAMISTFFSVGLASSLARYFGETLIARLDPFLHALRALFAPFLIPLHALDKAIFHLSPESKADRTEQAEQNVEEEILAVVEEGEKEGVVDETDREMIESVIEFKDTTAGQIMTARPDIVGLPSTASLGEILSLIKTSGHSRLPVYDTDLDHITGILYARDILHHLSPPTDGTVRLAFDLKRIVRPANYIPETKPLKDLLQEFKLRKVHLAIVLDEFGGTAGLVTIEDIIEELVGDIADEHEPTTPPALLKISDTPLIWEADASTYIDEVNTVIGLTLPEDDGYDTLGGYISHVLGHIPQKDEEFTVTEPSPIAWKVLDAEPTKVRRLRLTLLPTPTEPDSTDASETTPEPTEESRA